MGNIFRGEAEIVVGGKTLRLVLDTNALAVIEKEGRDFNVIGRLGAIDFGRHGITGARAAFYACLRRHHPRVTLEQVGDMLDDGDTFGAFAEVWPSLIEGAFPPLRGKLVPALASPPAAPESPKKAEKAEKTAPAPSPEAT